MGGFIKKDFIESLLEGSDILDVISEYTTLQKKGVNFFGLSPFVEEKTPSFCVSKTKQRFSDYASGLGGSVLTFLMEHKQISYVEAVEELAKKYNMAVEYENAAVSIQLKEASEKREELRPLVKATLKHYQKELLKLDVEHKGYVEVFLHRQYTQEIVTDWGIGYAPGNKFIYNLAKENGLIEPAKKVGLVSDKNQDKLWNRVTYPIHDERGLVIGIASRDLSGKKESAKWMNPPESDLYQKSNVWFALDRAKKEIVKKNEAWILEGYNDVIAWHTHEILNSISSSGTAIARKQMKLLKRYCNKVIIAMDPDAAGTRSMLKYIPEFYKEGFTVQVVLLSLLDPDDFVREHKKIIKDTGLLNALKKESEQIDGFLFLMNNHIKGTAVDKAQGSRKMVEIISYIADEALRDLYILWLNKESKTSKAILNKWLKESLTPEEAKVDKLTEEWEYNLPFDVKKPIAEIKEDVKKYGLFMDNNRIYYQTNTEPPYQFKTISNFSIEIIQHMQDEKFPTKLIKIKNIHNLEKIFDVPSEYLNSTQHFDNAMTAHGNFLYDGGRNELQKLRAFLFDKMGTGRKIDVLGWQTEGFFVWNNKITIPGKELEGIDENGIFKIDKTSYYVPSANKVYSNNQFRYDAQKRFSVAKSPVTFNDYTTRMIKVHGNHAINGILFSIASAFQDIVVNTLGSFPIFFMYGPGSTGKDQLAEACQSFFGVPQTAINLEGNASTLKAKIREFAQFSNSIGHLSEYKKVLFDGILKGLWDRRGYKRGTIESHVGTETIPILSSVILTGNEFPDSEPLIMRLIWNEMTKNEFTAEEDKNFQELQDITKGGISSLMDDLIKKRGLFEENFKEKYRMFSKNFGAQVLGSKSRMIQNMSVLGATYEIFKDTVQFPFTFLEMTDHFKECMNIQMKKINSASLINRWWNCFLASLRGHRDDRLQVKRDFKLEGEDLYFNFTNVYLKIQRQWYIQYKEAAPGKTDMYDKIKTSDERIAYKSSVRMDTGRQAIQTSADVIKITNLSLCSEIKSAISYQLAESDSIPFPPATPKKIKDPENIDAEQGDFFPEEGT